MTGRALIDRVHLDLNSDRCRRLIEYYGEYGAVLPRPLRLMRSKPRCIAWTDYTGDIDTCTATKSHLGPVVPMRKIDVPLRGIQR